MKIFEIHFEPENSDNFQTRIIEEEDWDTYIRKIESGNAFYESGLSLPRGAKSINYICGDKRIEYDYVVPATGKTMHHQSWVIQIE